MRSLSMMGHGIVALKIEHNVYNDTGVSCVIATDEGDLEHRFGFARIYGDKTPLYIEDLPKRKMTAADLGLSETA